jgi:hypothetical protein
MQRRCCLRGTASLNPALARCAEFFSLGGRPFYRQPAPHISSSKRCLLFPCRHKRSLFYTSRKLATDISGRGVPLPQNLPLSRVLPRERNGRIILLPATPLGSLPGAGWRSFPSSRLPVPGLSTEMELAGFALDIIVSALRANERAPRPASPSP